MDNNPDKVNLSFKGKSVVTAKDLQDASDQFEILILNNILLKLILVES